MKTKQQIEDEIHELKECRLHYNNLRVILEQLQFMERRRCDPDSISGSCEIEIEKCFNELNEHCSYIIQRCLNYEEIYKEILKNE